MKNTESMPILPGLRLARFVRAALRAAAPLAAAGMLCAQGVRICGSCSWELAPDARFCSHCGAPASGGAPQAAPAPEAAQPAAPEPAQPAPAQPDAVAQDIAQAAAFNKKGDGAAALAALLNARALAAAMPADAVSAAQRRVIFEGVDRLRAGVARSAPAQCPACKGTGMREIPVASSALVGTTSLGAASKKAPCGVCGGSGFIPRLQKSVLLSAAAGGAREYAKAAQIAGRKPFARTAVYMPEAMAAAFTAAQSNIITRAAADECESCAGFGVEPCAGCGGTGMVKCTEKGCADGFVKDPAPPAAAREKRLESMRMQTSRPCAVCGGLSFIRCPDCAGKGALPCKRCGGKM